LQNSFPSLPSFSRLRPANTQRIYDVQLVDASARIVDRLGSTID